MNVMKNRMKISMSGRHCSARFARAVAIVYGSNENWKYESSVINRRCIRLVGRGRWIWSVYSGEVERGRVDINEKLMVLLTRHLPQDVYPPFGVRCDNIDQCEKQEHNDGLFQRTLG